MKNLRSFTITSFLLSCVLSLGSWAQSSPDNSMSPHSGHGGGTGVDALAGHGQQAMPSPQEAQAHFVQTAKQIDDEAIRGAATQNNGRVKPLDTLARETILFASGSYSKWGLSATQIYLNFIVQDESAFVPLIEVRSPVLRQQLGAPKSQRFFSLAELESSPLMQLSEPLIQKSQENSKSLNEEEKKTLETFQQFQTLQMLHSGDHFFKSIDFSFLKGHGENAGAVNSEVQNAAKAYLQAIAAGQSGSGQAVKLVELTRSQETPTLFERFMNHLDLEVSYNDYRLILWASLLALLCGSLLLVPAVSKKMSNIAVISLSLPPLAVLAVALFIRVMITGFAPVTNMYTTMLWVALGVLLFSLLLFSLYKNRPVAALMLIGSGLILLLTEKTPLVLSPDMDPLVAVLRSNYWLSTHVTTITISYAAFSIAMLLGNAALIRVFTHRDNKEFFKEYAHYAYRMIQLGCFLLTVGIILGGIWADYSWGRFWGWDPKETWALIADLGFLSILHARQVGWVKDFSLLAWCPIAYLLVIMAWYGVNFVLAAGLHSYGFSSGGTLMILSFLTVQLALLAAAFGKLKWKNLPTA